MSHSPDFARLLAAASAAGPFGFIPAEGRRVEWQQCLAQLARQPVGYAWTHIAYQHAYFASVSPAYERLDCIVTWQGKPLGLWPLAWLGGGNGPCRLSSHVNGQAGIVPPLMPDTLSEKQQKSLARQWLGVTGEFAGAAAIESVVLAGPPVGGALPAWYRIAMEAGATVACRHRSQIDLTMPESDYHARMRKSFKALVNSARRTWTPRLDTVGDGKAFAAFEDFHIQVAGRRTRSAESWRQQYEAIVEGDAFAIYLTDEAGTLVGASLFNCSRGEALYAVGAYDRSLFDKPLAHLSLSEAIAHARERGLRRFILGDRPYPSDQPPPTDKEMQIAFFKEGFASELVLVPYLTASSDSLRRLTLA